jgi:hypothetical protein
MMHHNVLGELHLLARALLHQYCVLDQLNVIIIFLFHLNRVTTPGNWWDTGITR